MTNRVAIPSGYENSIQEIFPDLYGDFYAVDESIAHGYNVPDPYINELRDRIEFAQSKIDDWDSDIEGYF